MTNIKCHIAYAGTRYFGYQKTRMGPSIEELVQKALETILQHPIKLQAASRTDRGVHAKGQVINFFSEKENLCLEKLHHSLRRLLPPDIALIKTGQEEPSFHPTLSAKGKLYIYQICNQSAQLPFHREYSWHIPSPRLNLSKMEQAAAILEGRHDYSAFTSAMYADPVRTVEAITLSPLPENRLLIEVKGDTFLYKMVRNLVGTIVYLGLGKIPLEDLEKILQSKQRARAGICAPAHGLTLQQVFY